MTETGGAPAPAAQVSTDGGASVISGMTGTTGTPAAGRGGGGNSRGGGRGGGGRGRGGQRRTGGASASSATATKSTYRGHPDLGEHVFDLTSPTAAAASYSMTIEKIAEYIGTKWNGAHLIRDELLTMEEQAYPMPADPGSGATPIEKKISNAEVTEYVKDKIIPCNHELWVRLLYVPRAMHTEPTYF